MKLTKHTIIFGVDNADALPEDADIGSICIVGNINADSSIYYYNGIWNKLNNPTNIDPDLLLSKIKQVDGPNSGLDADTVDGLNGSQFQRNDTADVDIGPYPSTNEGTNRIIKDIGVFSDNNPGLILFAKKYDGSNVLPKQGFIGKVIVSRGGTTTYNFTEEYNIVCVSAYQSTKLYINGNVSNACLVEVTYNNEQWYGFYGNSMASRCIWLDGFLYTTQEPILIEDASSYTVTKVDGSDLYVNQYKVWNNGNDGIGSDLDADLLDGCNTEPNSCLGWNKIPVVTSEGIMEIGKYVDFHLTPDSTADYEPRLEAVDSDNLVINGNKVWHNGNTNVSFGTSGYQKLPNGLIIQWGGPVTVPASGGSAKVTFPIAFPNAFLQAFISVRSSATQMCGFNNETLTKMDIYTGAGDGTSRECHWMVIGY